MSKVQLLFKIIYDVPPGWELRLFGNAEELGSLDTQLGRLMELKDAQTRKWTTRIEAP